jgi:glucokinase-like ROK family protein
LAKQNHTANQNWVRKVNRSIILETLRTERTLSRARLADETGLNPSTVSNIIHELLDENLVRETELVQPAVGRPGRLLELNPYGGGALGVEINVDYIGILLTDFTANTLWRHRLASNPQDGQAVILSKAIDLIQEAIALAETHNLGLLGIGVGVPGLVDLRDGRLRIAPNLQWYDVPICDLLMNNFNSPIYIENEANAAALGEFYFGAARGVHNFIYLSAGVGLGSGIMIDKKLYRGSFGYASEVGHMTFDINGELCGCGRHGCWETFVGPRAVERRVQHTLQEGADSILRDMVSGDLEKIDFERVFEAAQKEDQVALNALVEVGRNLGIGIANLINAFNPELVVLGGALNLAAPIILPEAERIAYETSLPPNREHVRIVPSAHGTDACLMGAIALVLDDILREPMLG